MTIERLAGADGVKQADGRLADDPRDGGALMDGGQSTPRHAGQRQRLAERE